MQPLKGIGSRWKRELFTLVEVLLGGWTCNKAGSVFWAMSLEWDSARHTGLLPYFLGLLLVGHGDGRVDLVVQVLLPPARTRGVVSGAEGWVGDAQVKTVREKRVRWGGVGEDVTKVKPKDKDRWKSYLDPGFLSIGICMFLSTIELGKP